MLQQELFKNPKPILQELQFIAETLQVSQLISHKEQILLLRK